VSDRALLIDLGGRSLLSLRSVSTDICVVSAGRSASGGAASDDVGGDDSQADSQAGPTTLPRESFLSAGFLGLHEPPDLFAQLQSAPRDAVRHAVSQAASEEALSRKRLVAQKH
jgi:hypothetical protein